MFERVSAYLNRSIWKNMARSKVVCLPDLQPAARRVVKKNAWKLAETAAYNNSKIFIGNGDAPGNVRISIFDDSFFELNKECDFNFSIEKMKNPEELKRMLTQFFKNVF